MITPPCKLKLSDLAEPMTGYKTEPVGEYEHILSNLQEVLSEAEERFDTASIRMGLTAKANREEDVENWILSK